jgi:hypothetical protein
VDRVHKFDYELYELNMETREKQMNAVKQYTFIQVEPRQDAEDTWSYVESIDRIMELVFGGLTPKDMGRAAQVCRRWRNVAKFDRLWGIVAKRQSYDSLLQLKDMLPNDQSWKRLSVDTNLHTMVSSRSRPETDRLPRWSRGAQQT